jgi:hypothetical protein
MMYETHGLETAVGKLYVVGAAGDVAVALLVVAKVGARVVVVDSVLKGVVGGSLLLVLGLMVGSRGRVVRSSMRMRGSVQRMRSGVQRMRGGVQRMRGGMEGVRGTVRVNTLGGRGGKGHGGEDRNNDESLSRKEMELST